MSSAKRHVAPSGDAAISRSDAAARHRHPRSALERTISELIRGDESDAELDRIVADLIVREAREKEEARRSGGGSLESAADEGSSRRALDTRYLRSVMRDVQSHNSRAVITTDDSVGDHTDERHGRAADTQRRRHDDRSASDVRRGKMRGWSDDEHDDHREERRRGTGHDGRSSSRKGEHLTNESRRDHARHGDGKARHLRDKESSDMTHRRHRHSRRSASPVRHSRSPPRGESKMDRYFAPGYDPMLDVGATTEARIGDGRLLDDDDDQGWERMMSVVREREERRRERRETRDIERERRRKERKEEKRKAHRGDSMTEAAESEQGGGDDVGSTFVKVGKDALETRYVRRGGTREWDKGKQDLG